MEMEIKVKFDSSSIALIKTRVQGCKNPTLIVQMAGNVFLPTINIPWE